jgi:hypothetical protein
MLASEFFKIEVTYDYLIVSIVSNFVQSIIKKWSLCRIISDFVFVHELFYMVLLSSIQYNHVGLRIKEDKRWFRDIYEKNVCGKKWLFFSEI